MNEKKPLPGAMLVARLRERRAAQEQAAKEAADKKGNNSSSSAEPKEIKSKPQEEPQSNFSVTFIEEEEGNDTVVPAAPKAVPAKVTPKMPKTPNGDLIQRQISLTDLRPGSDDYFQLTDEIRLAGRFAAVGLIAQGLRLSRLRDDNIYKNYYQTFEEYCRQEHQMSATYAYRLIRMAEMAERVSEKELVRNMPDPFEVMLGLGHRHLMALLPLEIDDAETILVEGIEVNDGKTRKTIPLNKATEKQIKQALKQFVFSEDGAKEKAKAKIEVTPDLERLYTTFGEAVAGLESLAAQLSKMPKDKLNLFRKANTEGIIQLAKRLGKADYQILELLAGVDDDDDYE